MLFFFVFVAAGPPVNKTNENNCVFIHSRYKTKHRCSAIVVNCLSADSLSCPIFAICLSGGRTARHRNKQIQWAMVILCCSTCLFVFYYFPFLLFGITKDSRKTRVAGTGQHIMVHFFLHDCYMHFAESLPAIWK